MVKVCRLCGVSKPRSKYSHRSWKRNGNCSSCRAAVARINKITHVLHSTIQRCAFVGFRMSSLLSSFYAAGERCDFMLLLKEDKEWPTFSDDTIDDAKQFLADISAARFENHGVYTAVRLKQQLPRDTRGVYTAVRLKNNRTRRHASLKLHMPTRVVIHHEFIQVLLTTKSCKSMQS